MMLRRYINDWQIAGARDRGEYLIKWAEVLVAAGNLKRAKEVIQQVKEDQGLSDEMADRRKAVLRVVGTA
jgi:hypothetical protein